jgi:hypothetical protein
MNALLPLFEVFDGNIQTLQQLQLNVRKLKTQIYKYTESPAIIIDETKDESKDEELLNSAIAAANVVATTVENVASTVAAQTGLQVSNSQPSNPASNTSMYDESGLTQMKPQKPVEVIQSDKEVEDSKPTKESDSEDEILALLALLITDESDDSEKDVPLENDDKYESVFSLDDLDKAIKKLQNRPPKSSKKSLSEPKTINNLEELDKAIKEFQNKSAKPRAKPQGVIPPSSKFRNKLIKYAGGFKGEMDKMEQKYNNLNNDFYVYIFLNQFLSFMILDLYLNKSENKIVFPTIGKKLLEDYNSELDEYVNNNKLINIGTNNAIEQWKNRYKTKIDQMTKIEKAKQKPDINIRLTIKDKKDSPQTEYRIMYQDTLSEKSFSNINNLTNLLETVKKGKIIYGGILGDKRPTDKYGEKCIHIWGANVTNFNLDDNDKIEGSGQATAFKKSGNSKQTAGVFGIISTPYIPENENMRNELGNEYEKQYEISKYPTSIFKRKWPSINDKDYIILYNTLKTILYISFHDKENYLDIQTEINKAMNQDINQNGINTRIYYIQLLKEFMKKINFESYGYTFNKDIVGDGNVIKTDGNCLIDTLAYIEDKTKNPQTTQNPKQREKLANKIKSEIISSYEKENKNKTANKQDIEQYKNDGYYASCTILEKYSIIKKKNILLVKFDNVAPHIILIKNNNTSEYICILMYVEKSERKGQNFNGHYCPLGKNFIIQLKNTNVMAYPVKPHESEASEHEPGPTYKVLYNFEDLYDLI